MYDSLNEPFSQVPDIYFSNSWFPWRWVSMKVNVHREGKKKLSFHGESEFPQKVALNELSQVNVDEFIKLLIS